MPIVNSLRVLKFAALVSLAAATLWAQFDRGGSWLRGEIQTDDPSFSRNDLIVELLNSEHRAVDRVTPGLTGDFEFGNIAPGDYELRVTDRGGNVLREQSVQLGDFNNFVTVRLAGRHIERPASGQVSVAELSHNVPKKARKEFVKACQASDKGQSDAAIAHLEKALEIDPAYMQAYNNLGVQYMRRNEYGKAREQFQKAYELDHNALQVATNLAVADLNLKRYAEAETEARQAVKLDATSNKARFLLGVALNALRRNLDEAVENLEAAAREIPKGFLAAAEVLAAHGNALRAATDLRKYLASGKAERKEQLQAWLASLEQAAAMARSR